MKNKADVANDLAARINEITAYIEELKQERAVLMKQLHEHVSVRDCGFLTHMHATTAGRIIQGSR